MLTLNERKRASADFRRVHLWFNKTGKQQELFSIKVHFTHDYLFEGVAVITAVKQHVIEKQENTRAEAARVFKHSKSVNERSVSGSSHF